MLVKVVSRCPFCLPDKQLELPPPLQPCVTEVENYDQEEMEIHPQVKEEQVDQSIHPHSLYVL